MRTKTLLLSAALIGAGLISSQAQSNVYSANVVGYVNRTVPANPNDVTAPTFAFIANHLETGNNVLTNLLQGVPVNTKVLKWNPGSTSFNTYTRVALGAGWSPTGAGSNTVNLGEAVLIKLNAGNAVGYTNTFVGQVFQSTVVSFTNTLLPGFTAVSFPVPLDAIAVSNALVGLSAALPAQPNGSKVQKWDEVSQGGYITYTRTALGSGWSPTVPTVNAGVGFFVFNAASTNRLWICNFTVQ